MLSFYPISIHTYFQNRKVSLGSLICSSLTNGSDWTNQTIYKTILPIIHMKCFGYKYIKLRSLSKKTQNLRINLVLWKKIKNVLKEHAGSFFCENVVHCPYLLGNILEIESWKLDLNWNKIWGIFTRASLVCLTVDTRGELFFHSSFAFIPNWPLGILPWKTISYRKKRSSFVLYSV